LGQGETTKVGWRPTTEQGVRRDTSHERHDHTRLTRVWQLKGAPLACGKRSPVQDLMMRQRHLARHRHVAPADQSRVREGLVGGAKRASRHQGGAVARGAGDAVDAGGLDGLGQGHRRQDSREVYTKSVHRRLVQFASPNTAQSGVQAMFLCQCRVGRFSIDLPAPGKPISGLWG
jgi:hypothetical protein